MATTTSLKAASPTSSAVAGIAGGLVGGLGFGVLMQTMGMMPMVAMLARSESLVVGWLVHLLIAAAIGLSYGLIFAGLARTLLAAVVIGIAYGAVWWVLGALAAMPAILGMPTFTLNAAAWQSLMGHVIYGGLLGATYGLIRPRLA